MLSDELREMSAIAQEYLTDYTYKILVLRLKGEAYQGKRHFETTANFKDETTVWSEIVKKLETEGMKCEIDYCCGAGSRERNLKISW